MVVAADSTVVPMAVAAGDILRAGFGVELPRFEGQVAQENRVEIVAAPFGTDQFDAGVERPVEPERRDVLFGHRQQQRNVVVRADFGEGARRIAGRGDHQNPVVALADAGADAVCFGLLERAGRHLRADLGIIAVEGDIEVFQAEVVGQTFAFVGYGCARTLQHAADRQPVAEFVEAVAVGTYVDLPDGVTSADHRRDFAAGIVEHPAFVFELPPRSDAFERVMSGCKILHVVSLGIFGFQDMRPLKSA